MIASDHATLYAVVLFVIGLAGVLVRRNLVMMLVSVEIMLNAVNLHVLALSRRDAATAAAAAGEGFALFVILVAACEAAVGLGLFLAIRRIAPRLEVDELEGMKD